MLSVFAGIVQAREQKAQAKAAFVARLRELEAQGKVIITGNAAFRVLPKQC